MTFDVSYQREVLVEYYRIPSHHYAKKINYYKKNEKVLESTPLNERLDIEEDFLMALYKNGELKEYLRRCKPIVEKLFDSELFPRFEREKLYNLLFHKASCHLKRHELERSKQDLKKLVKLYPNVDKESKVLIEKFFRKNRELFKFQARGLVIALILTSSILSVWGFLVIDPFYPEHILKFQITVGALFVLGIAIWTASIYYTKVMAQKDMNEFIEKEKKRN